MNMLYVIANNLSSSKAILLITGTFTSLTKGIHLLLSIAGRDVLGTQWQL